MDVGIAQFWGGIAVVALASAVNIFITLYKTHKTSSDLRNQMDDNKDSLEKNIDANIASLEKELKTKIGVEVLSKNRQEWINDLRKTINDTYHLINITTIKFKNSIQSNTIDDFLEEMQNNIYQVRKLKNYLELLLNPKEESYAQITEAIELVPNNLQQIFNTAVKYSNKEIGMDNAMAIMNTHIDEIYRQEKRILESTQRVLKEEWERVKKGV